jgi:hypothetical protein
MRYERHNERMSPTKAKPNIEFRPTEMRSGSGWYVQVVLPSVPPLQLGGFKTEDEAKEWVRQKALHWLKGFDGGKYAYAEISRIF